MDDPPVPTRTLSPREVRFVIRRAADLQRQEAQALAASQAADLGYLTSADLEQVAEEVGVDPYYLDRAADELEERGVPIDLTGLLGGPFAIQLEHTLPVELGEKDLQELVTEIEMAVPTNGTVRVTPTTLLWRTKDANDLMPVEVALRARGGNTRIGIEQRFGGLVAVLYGSGIGGVGLGVGLGVGIGVGIGALQSPTFALLFSTGWIAASFLVCRQMLATIRQSRQRKLLDLLDRLLERASETASETVSADASSSAPRT